MDILIVVPNLHHKYSFSAPLAWLFSSFKGKLRGVYSEELNKELVTQFDTFFVECNWFVELYEFSLIVKFIKKHNENAKIIFGGLYSQLKYRDIFDLTEVDYFIKGFNEKPLKLFFEGTIPEEIPNFVGRDFENETTLSLDRNDLKDIHFDLSWFPDYFKNWNLYPAPDIDLEPDFSRMPLFPSYNYPKEMKNPEKEFRIPTKGGRYHLPMIVTSRGGCSSIHDGCDYCMGAKKSKNREIYNTNPVIYTNDILISHITEISQMSPYMTLYINSPFEYDFTEYNFNISCTLEIDTKITAEQLKKIMYSFNICKVHLALYETGHHGKKILQNYEEFLELEDENHKIYFFAFKEDAESLKIPQEKRLYSEFVFPKWTDWNYYSDFKRAYAYSKRFYFITRQYHLYPQPIKLFLFVRNYIIMLILLICNRLGFFHPENEMS